MGDPDELESNGEEDDVPESAEVEPVALVDEGDDWPADQHTRVLLRRLHDAIEAHIEAGDLQPSDELDLALRNARVELDWN